MALDVFLPNTSRCFGTRRCMCGDPLCREIQQRFKKVNDARCGFFSIQAEEAGRRDEAEEEKEEGTARTMAMAMVRTPAEARTGAAPPPAKGGGTTTTTGTATGATTAAATTTTTSPPPTTTAGRKRRIIEALVGGGPILRKSYIAMLHFPPSDLRWKCWRRRGNKHVYWWFIDNETIEDDSELVTPSHPLQEALKDVRETEKAMKKRPMYTARSKKSTEEIVALFLGEPKKDARREQKRIADFALFIRKQIKKGRMIPLEKEARLEQIGFFRKFPRPEVVEAVVGQDVNNKKTTDGIVVVGTGSS
eukprot:CAMPEP_0113627130 /NCGR_PEP_ID=MMETSP0017_2-20120614/14043_1 /TAXON_ID=2856 /ORGANISM="Cylindrotheca closterium" /LENGTH=305 /DNA_ID=CAMNT_0000537359 /DNA_START=107 /DNA_END=1020 /DNA_ORIENTATION=+ /assembly_acc=CAM_ASM_000147